MEPTAKLLSEFFREKYGSDTGSIKVSPIGRGSHGRGFRVSFLKGGQPCRLIVKKLDRTVGLGHDYPSDRAGVFLLAEESYNKLPDHIKATDVLSLGKGDRIFSVNSGREYYLVMEEAEGVGYFNDITAMGDRDTLTPLDRDRITALARYLARIHSKKKVAPALYLRKLRDTIGHGECLMGVFDTYNGAKFTNLTEMADIEKSCIDRRCILKPMHARLSVTHGDFHPGNILFRSRKRFHLLDRSRGEFGEPADDVTALTINYIFYSLIRHGRLEAAYAEALRLFYDQYIELTGDTEVTEVSALFYAFRGAVVANPMFYPEVTDRVRGLIFAFIHGVLHSENFVPTDVNDFIDRGVIYRKRFA